MKRSKFTTREGLFMLLGVTLILIVMLAHLVWHRADQPLKKVSRNSGYSISVVEAKTDF